MISTTGSSNTGHGICCKPDFFGDNCDGKGDLECSQPTTRFYTDEKYRGILTGGMNHQMFAFLPMTNPKMCGISSSTEVSESGMKLTATKTKQMISLVGA